jgi:hypothetical protein
MQGIQNTIPTASGTVPGQTTKVQNPIQYLPVGLFGATVALSGLGIAWKQSTALFGAPPVIANAVTLLT